MTDNEPLRAAARAIYEAVYPSEEWTPVAFDEAERCATIHYRQAVDAARQVHAALRERPAPSSYRQVG